MTDFGKSSLLVQANLEIIVVFYGIFILTHKHQTELPAEPEHGEHWVEDPPL